MRKARNGIPMAGVPASGEAGTRGLREPADSKALQRQNAGFAFFPDRCFSRMAAIWAGNRRGSTGLVM